MKTKPSTTSGMSALYLLLLLLCSFSAQAQLFKWVGPDGKVTYSDLPPPASVTKVERKSLSVGGPGDTALPFELAEAVKNNPVTLYTTAVCVPCDDARAFLRTRGVPFTEKTVNTNADQLKLREIGDTQIPLLIIGRNKQQGYEPGAWNAALNAAAYPTESQLPANYPFRPPEPAAPPPKAPEKKPPVVETPPPQREAPKTQPVDPNTPPGFRF